MQGVATPLPPPLGDVAAMDRLEDLFGSRPLEVADRLLHEVLQEGLDALEQADRDRVLCGLLTARRPFAILLGNGLFEDVVHLRKLIPEPGLFRGVEVEISLLQLRGHPPFFGTSSRENVPLSLGEETQRSQGVHRFVMDGVDGTLFIPGLGDLDEELVQLVLKCDAPEGSSVSAGTDTVLIQNLYPDRLRQDASSLSHHFSRDEIDLLIDRIHDGPVIRWRLVAIGL